MEKRKITLAEFSKIMVDRFEECNEREIIIYHGKDGKMRGLVDWVINCLSNPNYEHAEYVLQQISEKRKAKK